MDSLLITLLAVSLAMDCFAVSLAAATSTPARKTTLAFVFGLSFGFFQAAMMMAGWLAGSTVLVYIEPFSRWAAFVILVFIGGTMIYEGFRGEEQGRGKNNYLAFGTVLLLSFATSMDSLGVGMGLAFLSDGIVLLSLSAGIASFLFSWAGAMLGGLLSREYGERMEIVGGIILLAIGIRILLELF